MRCELVSTYYRFGGILALKMESIFSSEALAFTYKYIWLYIEETYIGKDWKI
jgi:hypothetical protein